LTCIQREGLGESCSDSFDCRPSLQCVGPDGSKMCSRPARSGEACDTSGSAPDCNRLNREVCIRGICAPQEIVGLGEQCDGFSKICPITAQCLNLHCEALRSVGEPCDDISICEVGGVCVDGICEARRAGGSPCRTDHECKPGLRCFGARGNLICQTFAWRECPGIGQ
jgi:hypothetical protein